MVELASNTARSHSLEEKNLRVSMTEIARNSYGDGGTVSQALEEGWKRSVGHTMADGIITQAEETKLREFRDRLALADSDADRQATARLDKASRDRLALDARLPAGLGTAPRPTDRHTGPGLGVRGRGRPGRQTHKL